MWLHVGKYIENVFEKPVMFIEQMITSIQPQNNDTEEDYTNEITHEIIHGIPQYEDRTKGDNKECVIMKEETNLVIKLCNLVEQFIRPFVFYYSVCQT